MPEQINLALVQLGDASSQTVESLRQASFAIDELSQVAVGLRSGRFAFQSLMSELSAKNRAPRCRKNALFLVFYIGNERYALAAGRCGRSVAALATQAQAHAPEWVAGVLLIVIEWFR